MEKSSKSNKVSGTGTVRGVAAHPTSSNEQKQDDKLQFIIFDDNPSQITSDDSIRRIVRSNARRARNGGAGLQSTINKPRLSPALENNVESGKSRFALTSRKPITRVRRKAAGGKEKIVNLNAIALPVTHHICRDRRLSKLPLPKAPDVEELFLETLSSVLTLLTYSSTYMSGVTSSKVSTMSQHFFIQVVDIQHGLAKCELDDLFKRDEAIFHASLSIASVYYDTGANDLFHCQRTLNLVARRLGDRALQASDETIGAVGLLVIHNILTGSKEPSTLHLNGIEQMVRTRGGLDRLPARLKRTLGMIDLFNATTWNCRPRFPFMQPDDGLAAAFSSSLSKAELGLLQQHERTYMAWGMDDILQILRILTSVRFKDPLAVFNRLALSDAIYLLEYRLVSSDEGLDPTLNSGINDVFRFASLIYINKVLREMPPRNLNNLVSSLVNALKSAFSSGATKVSSGYLNWKFLLWVLVIGKVACQDEDESNFLQAEIVRVCNISDLRLEKEFRKCLDAVGPALHPYNTQCEEIWTAISSSARNPRGIIR